MGPAVFKIIPATLTYGWGKQGKESRVAQLATASQIPDFKVDEGTAYAELWMGTYPKAPAKLRSSGQLLSEHLESQPALIGSPILGKFKEAPRGELPFLFKVLSIGKALSIQIHPDKESAEKLHKANPDMYGDPNHKPEMALAITPFSALIGFRPLKEIAHYVKSVPELNSVPPKEVVDKFLSVAESSGASKEDGKAALKDLFASIITADENKLKEAVQALVQRYKAGKVNDGEEQELVKLVLTLDSQFPSDVGIFAAFILNYIHLSPGEAIFIAAGTPHGYISGDCFECMANSDNIIHAGLTPDEKDIPNFISSVVYNPVPPSELMLQPQPFKSSSDASTLFDPPISELSIVQIKVGKGRKEEHHPLGGPSIAIVTEGKGTVTWGATAGQTLDVGPGDAFFIGAGTGVTFENKLGDGELLVCRAFVEN
ncbi:hypothetical protein D9613_007303 [Agrocybe pediades]|uniref:Mannose-6-phosphate isomerase n=1 Tax=Agrocybe pediades TaxID=84607 RepID=A0A8H4QHM6_9AGAR|nr:hypothetical protein D9613_007303 [Agrocybe pediades]